MQFRCLSLVGALRHFRIHEGMRKFRSNGLGAGSILEARDPELGRAFLAIGKYVTRAPSWETHPCLKKKMSTADDTKLHVILLHFSCPYSKTSRSPPEAKKKKGPSCIAPHCWFSAIPTGNLIASSQQQLTAAHKKERKALLRSDYQIVLLKT